MVTSPQPAVAANGEELDLLGQSDTVIHVGGLAKKHTVLIAKGLVQECNSLHVSRAKRAEMNELGDALLKLEMSLSSAMPWSGGGTLLVTEYLQ